MRIFCSGIGGIGLSAYASLQRAAGHTVMGSDRTDSDLIVDLKSQGIAVTLNQDGSALPEDCDLFVYSEAIPEDAPERVLAQQRGVRSISYFHALGEISEGSRVIAVAGTHGKSSTTAMVARLLIEAGLDPTVVVGTKVPELSWRNWRKGNSNLFVVEACEYRRSFHFLLPNIILLTSVDGDHFDAYADLAEYQHAFTEFIARIPTDGVVIAHGNDADSRLVVERARRTLKDVDVYPLVSLRTPGLHMRQNAQLVLGLADVLGIPQDSARRILSEFAGTWRRMEVKGEWNGVTVIDDYGHHPREIRATLSAMREAYPLRRIVCVFQPHTHDRTYKLYDDFLSAFVDADLVIIPEIYAARSEVDSVQVDPAQFVEDLRKHGVDAQYGQSLSATQRLLQESVLRPGDVLVCMGAGTITQLPEAIMAGRAL